MADQDASEPKKPKEPPKPVHIGGETLIERLLPHLKKIIVMAILVAVVLTGVFGYRWWKQRKESQATEKLAAVLAVANRPVAPPGMPIDDKQKDPPYADEKARAQKVLDEIQLQDTTLAGPAYRASMLLDLGKVDEAIAEYKKCPPGEKIEQVLCREGLGIAIETKALAEKDAAARQKGLEEALAAFVAMQPAEDGPRRAYALYHQGRIQLLLGKRAEAKTLFEKAKDLSPPMDLSQLIERRLTSLGAS
ncbi:MAG TPA: hypothetical protein VFQ53_06305 [Kofleriaceae bacterium]|nr:hypothetical protein [Kofleriaceae bacterium]